jgi:hypothetical protein
VPNNYERLLADMFSNPTEQTPELTNAAQAEFEARLAQRRTVPTTPALSPVQMAAWVMILNGNSNFLRSSNN